jgi:hypothetical protein
MGNGTRVIEGCYMIQMETQLADGPVFSRVL